MTDTSQDRDRQTPRGLLALAALALALALALPATAAAAPEELGEFCKTGTGASECRVPRGVAVDPDTGNVYVMDQANRRVNEFGPWGTFIRAWGWGVLDGSPELQTCTAESGCEAGIAGEGSGQFATVTGGIALDSSGGVYVVDVFNYRVQRFDVPADPEEPVSFVLTFGGEVNKTTGEDLCTAGSGDTCGAGTHGNPGPGEGEFGTLRGGSYIAIDHEAPERIYLGDQDRIQVFDTEGAYLDQVEFTGKGNLGEAPEPGLTGSLALDESSGDLYLAYFNGVNVNQTEAENNVLRIDTETGALKDTLEVEVPEAVATDAEGNAYVFAQRLLGGGELNVTRLLRFDPGGEGPEVIDANKSNTSTDRFDTSSGIATSSPPTCGLEGTDVYVANTNFANAFVRLYGPPPDPGLCPPPLVAPTIGSQFASQVDTSGATVGAKVNPHFWDDATYEVQYGTGKCSEGGCPSLAPASPQALTAKVIDAEIATKGIFLGGLAPDTTYHYRFIARSSGGGPAYGGGEASEEAGTEGSFHTYPVPPAAKSDCPNQPLRFGASARLPDCRAYEMVSPLDKNNGDVSTGVASYALSSVEGGRATYSSYRAFADPEGAPLGNQYLAEREGGGWRSEAISAPRESLTFYQPGEAISALLFKGFSPDLCSAGMVQDSDIQLSDDAPAEVPGLYRRINCGACPLPAWEPARGGCYESLTPVFPPGFGYEPADSYYFPEYQGASADQQRSVFRADAALIGGVACETPENGIYQVYEQIAGQGLELVSVLPTGAAACRHSSAGTAQGLPGEFREDSLRHAVSADGTRVFWTRTDNSEPAAPTEGGKGSGGQPGHLYLRANVGAPQSVSGGCDEAGKACTLEISDLVSGEPARFLVADPEGTSALFRMSGSLYEFRLLETGGKLEGEVEALSGGLLGLMGASEDLGRVYLVSTLDHTGAEENSEGETAEAGEPNLYLREDGEFTFVGRLSEADVRFANVEALFSASPSPIATRPSKRTSRVAPDGLAAAFTSTAPLTGFDNTDAASGEPDAEVFVYDADSDELDCVSCSLGGARPTGRQIFSGDNGDFQLWAVALLPGWTEALAPTRLLSESGERLFFESFEPLVPRDTNGRADVYEWQRVADEEACLKGIGGDLYLEESSGCLALISSGKSPTDSHLFDASADGGDVLFATSAGLWPEDPGLIDVYDARAGGGFPLPAQASECEGQSCQSRKEPPEARTPASESFEGPGNLAAPARPRCARPTRRAKRLSARARRERRSARLAGKRNPRAAKRLRHKAARYAKAARKHSKRARRCRARGRAAR